MQNPKFSLFKSTVDQQFYYRLRGKNGEIILSGEGYITKQACLNGIAEVKVNAPMDVRYERKSNHDHYTFSLKSSNGDIIGCSEAYTSIGDCETGIYAVKRDATYAPIEDLA